MSDYFPVLPVYWCQPVRAKVCASTADKQHNCALPHGIKAKHSMNMQPKKDGRISEPEHALMYGTKLSNFG